VITFRAKKAARGSDTCQKNFEPSGNNARMIHKCTRRVGMRVDSPQFTAGEAANSIQAGWSR